MAGQVWQLCFGVDLRPPLGEDRFKRAKCLLIGDGSVRLRVLAVAFLGFAGSAMAELTKPRLAIADTADARQRGSDQYGKGARGCLRHWSVTVLAAWRGR